MSNIVKILVGAIELKVVPKYCSKEEFLRSSIYYDLRDELTYTVPDYKFTTAYKQFHWDGKKVLINKKLISKAGCYQRISRFLSKQGIETTILFKNDYTANGDIDIRGIVPDKFQLEAVENAVKERYCVISAPVRAGKTAIIGMYLAKLEQYPALIITNGKDLVIQTQQDLNGYLQQPIGSFTESVYNPEQIMVTSYQALRRVFAKKAKKEDEDDLPESEEIIERNVRILEFLRRVKVLILDECHHATSDKNKYFLEKMTAVGYKLGVSGTPKADHSRKLELESAVGPIVKRVKFKTLIETGRIAQPVVIMYDLPYAWFVQHLTDYPDLYQSNVVHNIYRNRFVSEIVEGLRKEGKTAFIMIRNLDHGPILRDLIPGSIFVNGNTPSKTRKSLYEGLQKKEISCIIGTVGKEGLNIPSLDAIINVEGLEGKVITQQKMRSLTASEGKTHGLIIDFLDKGKYLDDHSESRLGQYKHLGGFIIKYRKVSRDHFKDIEQRWRG